MDAGVRWDFTDFATCAPRTTNVPVCSARCEQCNGTLHVCAVMDREAVEAVEALLDRRSEGPPPRDRSRLARHRSALEKVRTLRGIGGSS